MFAVLVVHMPDFSSSFSRSSPTRWYEEGCSELPSDEEFDHIFPDHVRHSSMHHWSTVEVCRHAADWLVTADGTRVLDVGCGPGKFCAIGAAFTQGHFTGVEQRRNLCRTARQVVNYHNIPRVEILHSNVTEVAFTQFDAFYFFNPFQENLVPMLKIDDEVPVEFEYYARYINYVRKELATLPHGTRVVTYWGDCHEIPPCYDCVETAFENELRLWIKRRTGELAACAYDACFITENCEFSIV